MGHNIAEANKWRIWPLCFRRASSKRLSINRNFRHFGYQRFRCYLKV